MGVTKTSLLRLIPISKPLIYLQLFHQPNYVILRFGGEPMF